MRWLVLGLAIAAAGCDTKTPEEVAAENARAVAEVEAHQKPPPEQIVPDKIGYREIEKFDLFGAGCNFAPDGGGLGAVAIAQSDRGYMVVDRELVRFAADKGSPELPYLARRKYDGMKHSFTLDLDPKSGEQSGMETTDYRGRLTVRDGQDNIVYDARGMVQCGA